MSTACPLLDLETALMETHVLPHLSAAAVGCLACTCRHLHSLGTGAPVTTWQALASEVLGAQHPALQPATTGHPPSAASLQAALHRYSHACQGLRTGRYSMGALPAGSSSCSSTCRGHACAQGALLSWSCGLSPVQ